MSRIHLSAADIGPLEERAVARAVSSGWIAPMGPDVEAFEREIADYVGVAHGVATASGTAALHLALLAAGVGPGMAVVTSTFTFAATANAIVYTGAAPVFVDSDPDSGNVDVALIDEAIGELQASGTRVGAILSVDIYGKAVDAPGLEAVGTRYGVPVVTDSAEALGSSRSGRRAGSVGLASAVSFNGNKIMTTSGGGMMLTDDDDAAALARRLAAQARQPVDHYEHTEVGFNYRLSNILAAMGRAQLSRLDSMIERRRSIRDRYREIVEAAEGVAILGGTDDATDNCWLTCITIDPDAGASRAGVRAALADDDIETRRLWKPMHLQPVFRSHRSVVTGVAEDLFTRGLSLPSGSSLFDADVQRVCDSLARSLGVSRA